MSAAVQTCTARPDGYVRRDPEATLLYQLVRAHWPVFLERAEEQGGLPGFVVRDFEEYLRCGVLEHGLVHLACSRCGHEMVVAFSCKRRGFCPSCLGRRMNDIAAHLVDEVLPEVPIRQWVCSLPWAMRCMFAFDRALCAEVLGAFITALTRSLRRRAKRVLRLRSVEDARVGALTMIQRSDGALRVNPHFHTLALDGVYVRDEQGELGFRPLPAPSAEEVAEVAAWTHAGIARVLARHGRSLEGADDAPDELASEQPVLASCYAASAGDVQLLGKAPGQQTAKLVQPVRLVPAPADPLANVGGVNVHAGVAFDGRDRARLERLCRYLARPPLAQERLSLHSDGRVRLGFKAPWKDGTHAVLLDPLDLIARLAALVPPPRFHMLRYHGVLASHAAVRAEVVPGREPPSPPPQLPLFEPSEATLEAPPPSRHPWSWLLRRDRAVLRAPSSTALSRSPSVPSRVAAAGCACSTSRAIPTTSRASSTASRPERDRRLRPEHPRLSSNSRSPELRGERGDAPLRPEHRDVPRLGVLSPSTASSTRRGQRSWAGSHPIALPTAAGSGTLSTVRMSYPLVCPTRTGSTFA